MCDTSSTETSKPSKDKSVSRQIMYMEISVSNFGGPSKPKYVDFDFVILQISSDCNKIF